MEVAATADDLCRDGCFGYEDHNQNPFHVWFKVVDVRKSGFFPTVKYTPLASLRKLQMANPFQRLNAPVTPGFGWVPTRLPELEEIPKWVC